MTGRGVTRVAAGLAVLLAGAISGGVTAAASATKSAAAATAAGAPTKAARTLVVCAPGYPGTTADAQPIMDAFARDAGAAAGWPSGSLAAVYHETAARGLKRLRDPDAVLALVPLPLFLQFETELKLTPRLQVVQGETAVGTWGLVAKRGRVTSAAALDGFEISGVAGYAPGFVRGVVLAGLGALPASARITFTPTPLASLRRAAAGEPIAVVVDAAQGASLASLPFGGDLEIVARSPALPGTVLCVVGGRLKGKGLEALIGGLHKLHTRSDWAATLASLRMTRFEPVDTAALDVARKGFAGTPSSAPAQPRP